MRVATTQFFRFGFHIQHVVGQIDYRRGGNADLGTVISLLPTSAAGTVVIPAAGLMNESCHKTVPLSESIA